jgi:hypothetical protein
MRHDRHTACLALFVALATREGLQNQVLDERGGQPRSLSCDI